MSLSARLRGRSDQGGRDEAGALVDAAWYLATYPDTAKVLARDHYLSMGWREGRNPNRYFDTNLYIENYMGGSPTQCPLVNYVNRYRVEDVPPNPIVDPKYLREKLGASIHISALEWLFDHPEADHVAPWFSRRYYLEQNPDVSASPFAPEVHLLRHGLGEQRQFAAGHRFQSSAHTSPETRLRSRFFRLAAEFKTEGAVVSIFRERMSPAVERQILQQASIDPDVVAAGAKVIANLPQFVATDIRTRDLVDIRRLLALVGRPAFSVIILPRLQIGGAEKYAANLAAMLRARGEGDILLVTTDSSPEEDEAALRHDIFQGLQGVRIASLRDELRSSWRKDQILALLMLRSGPKHIFVVNSELGLQMVSAYGRALRTESRLYCTFFSESPLGVGAPYSARYLRPVLPHSTILSDNQRALDHLSLRVGAVGAQKMACLPSIADLDDGSPDRVVHRRVKPRRVLWVSRWERFKAPEILVALAKRMPEVQFRAYGPIQGDYPAQLPSNLVHRGLVQDDAAFNVADYDAFVFTSLFEGMPNTVLEMACEGIPIVASDVGGLRETFASGEVELVSMDKAETRVEGFVAALNRVFELSSNTKSARTQAARAAVLKRHARSSVEATLSNLLARP